MVQYKAMEMGTKEAEFRWTPGDDFSDELQRMDAMALELEQISDDGAVEGFRLHNDPFYFKFCPRISFNPDSKALFNGMYVPRSLWHRMVKSGRLKGKNKGNVLTYANAGRRFQNHEFISLVSNSWIGTTVPQSESIEQLIRTVLSGNKAVVYAVKRRDPPAPPSASGHVQTGPIVEEDEEEPAVVHATIQL